MYDELELDKLGDRKTVLFLIMSDTDSTFNFLISICRPYILLQLTVANGFCTCGANFQAIRSIKKEMFL